VNLRDSMGRHALHLAAEADSAASVQFLVIDIGVNINLQTDTAHDTALHFSAKVCHIIQSLCDSTPGVYYNVKNVIFAGPCPKLTVVYSNLA